MSKRLTPRIVEAEQRSEQWFAERLGRVTGSKGGHVLDYYKPTLAQVNKAILAHKEMETPQDIIDKLAELYPRELVVSAGLELQEGAQRKSYREGIVGERLTGLPADPDTYITQDMRWGMLSEPLAIALYQVKSRVVVESAPLMLHPELECGASPDGLVIDKDTGLLGNVEVKCLRTANHLYKIIRDQIVPDDYTAQIQMQMWINGRDFCDFVGFDSRVPEGLKIYIKRVPRDDFYIDYVLEPAVTRFLDECDRDFKYFWAKVKEYSKPSHYAQGYG